MTADKTEMGYHLDLWNSPLEDWVNYTTDFDEGPPYEGETDLEYALRIITNATILQVAYWEVIHIPLVEGEGKGVA